MYCVDETGRITFVNRTLCELLGADRPEQLMGQDHHHALGHCLPPGEVGTGNLEGADSGKCALCASIGNAEAADGCLSLRGRDQEPLPIEFISRPITTEVRHEGALIIVRDLRRHRTQDDQQNRSQPEPGQLLRLVEASPNLLVVGRSDGQVQWMNNSGRELLGIAADEDMSTYTIQDMFAPGELERIQKEDMQALVRTGRWKGERTLLSRAGESIPVDVSSRLHHDDDSPEGYYVTEIMRDLRPQLEQERILRLNESLLSAAETVARLGSWQWNPETDEVKWSRGLYRLFGMEPGDGDESVEVFLMALHPDDRARIAEILAGVAEGDGILDFVCRSSRADGTPLIIQCRGEVLDEPGAVRVIVGSLLDITEQHAALAAEQWSQELARRVLESAGEAYVQFSTEGLVTEWNVQAERTFGWTRSEAIGRPLAARVAAPAERDSIERLLGLHSDPDSLEQLADHFDHLMVHSSGRGFPAEVTVWTTEDGSERVFSCVIRDVSERRAAERAKNEFVAVVGHELRTPLTSIHGALGLLRAGLLGDLNTRGQQMVDIAAHNTERLVRLINDILDIERLDSGKVALKMQACDVAALAGRSLEVMRAMADGAGVRLTLEAQPSVYTVDPDRIEQALTNLLSNAIKFSPADAEVRLVVRPDPGSLLIQVVDQGRGIPAEDLERIFDRFQQVDGSDAREKGGTGLGLAICRSIAEQHGGRIWAESTRGCGAILTMRLPSALAVDVDVRVEAPDGRKVVVCSEDASVRARIVEMLLPYGYAPVEVRTSSALLAASLQHRPAAILLEQGTPTVAICKAAVDLREHPETLDIPVVLLALDGDTIFTEFEGPAGVKAPWDVSRLLATLGEATGKGETGIKVLLVEDDGGLAAVMTEGFRQYGIDVQHAPTARQALALCTHTIPDLVVLDLKLPDQDGFAVVAQMRRDARLRGVPLAVYSARDLTEADRERLRLGRTEFFTKGRVNPDEFERHVVDLLGYLTADDAKAKTYG